LRLLPVVYIFKMYPPRESLAQAQKT